MSEKTEPFQAQASEAFQVPQMKAASADAEEQVLWGVVFADAEGQERGQVDIISEMLTVTEESRNRETEADRHRAAALRAIRPLGL